jgi:dihydrofolate reductase
MARMPELAGVNRYLSMGAGGAGEAEVPERRSNGRAGAGAVRVSLVVAVADNGVIGRGGALPWHLPDDLKHFKAVTLGKAVLMGRRTFESIGRALPGRRNLVMSRATGLAKNQVGDVPRAAANVSAPVPAAAADGVEYVGSVEEACALIAPGAADSAELCVIGGAQVYALALPRARRIYLTRVHAAVDGDVYFPAALSAASGGNDWREVERVEHPADARHAHAMSFVRLER